MRLEATFMILWRQLKFLSRRAAREADLDRELRDHIELEAEEQREAGVSPNEATYAARRALGNATQIKEDVRIAWGFQWLETLLRDLRYGLRQLRRNPGFTTVAVVTLALGIGATTAIFSIVDGVLLRPLPFPNANQLVTLGDQVSGPGEGHQGPGFVSGPEVVIYPRDTRAFQSLGAYAPITFGLSGIGRPTRIKAARLTPSVFSALGVAPLMGHVITAREDRQKEQVAVLSFATWKGRFNGDPHVLGTKILLERKPYVIIGVMPRNFQFPLSPGRLNRSELWVPMSLGPQEQSPEAYGSWRFQMIGRLKSGITPAQAQSDANRVAQQIMRCYPPDLANFRMHAVVHPLQQITVLHARPLLRMLFLAVIVVLLIACANVASLLLVRSIRRQRETAVRLALGAPALTLLRQTILESLALSLSGGLLGIGIAALALNVGKDFLPETLPLINEITFNWSVAGFGLLLALITGLICGLFPGLAALHTDVNASLKEGAHSASVGHVHLRSTLVVAEIAIALVLLCASGLLLRSFSNMSAVDVGFSPDHVTTAAYALPRQSYSTQVYVNSFNSRLLQKLGQLPGVESVGITSTLPTTGGFFWAFVVDGYADPRGPNRFETNASPSLVIGDYFKAMGIPLIRGRYFTESDNSNSQLVVIVNREFAQHYWPHQGPIGRRMRIGTMKPGTPWMTVIGEIADAKLNSPDTNAVAQFYLPVAQLEKDIGTYASPTNLNGTGGYIVVRSVLAAQQMENVLRDTFRSIDPQLPLTHVETMDQVVSQSEAPRRFNTIVISSFALAAVLLVVLGIYSIIAFSVASRVHEMAIRMSLGSPRSHIMRLVLVAGLKLTAIGCVLGLAGAAAASRILRPFLFHVSPLDPAVMIAGATAVFVLALAALALPAHRAAKVDPMVALRHE